MHLSINGLGHNPLRDGPVFPKQSCCQGLLALSRRGTCGPNNSKSPLSEWTPLFNYRAYPIRDYLLLIVALTTLCYTCL